MKISANITNNDRGFAGYHNKKKPDGNYYIMGSTYIIEKAYSKSNFFDKVKRKLSLRNVSMVVRSRKKRDRNFSNIIELNSKHYYENFDIRFTISPFVKRLYMEKLILLKLFSNCS